MIQLAAARTCSVVESAPQATRIEMVFHLAVLPQWAQGAIRHAPFPSDLKRQLARPPMLAMPMGTSEIAVEPKTQRDTIWRRVAHVNCWRPCFGALLYKRRTR